MLEHTSVGFSTRVVPSGHGGHGGGGGGGGGGVGVGVVGGVGGVVGGSVVGGLTHKHFSVSTRVVPSGHGGHVIGGGGGGVVMFSQVQTSTSCKKKKNNSYQKYPSYTGAVGLGGPRLP